MLGFTKQEQGIVLFLIFSLFVGASVKLYDRFFSETSAVEINQEFVSEFNAKSEQINSRLSREPVPPLEKALIKRGNDLVSKEAQVSKDREVQNSTVEHSDEFALIDINSATEGELQIIPRIGPVLAQRIVQYRLETGQFNHIEDIKQVKGIGQVTFTKIAPYISINSDGSDSN